MAKRKPRARTCLVCGAVIPKPARPGEGFCSVTCATTALQRGQVTITSVKRDGVAFSVAPTPPENLGNMARCVAEQLEWILGALPKGWTFEDWYEDQEISALIGEPGQRDPNVVESVCHALGYLRGVADQLDCTLLEMLWQYRHDYPQTFGALLARKGE